MVSVSLTQARSSGLLLSHFELMATGTVAASVDPSPASRFAYPVTRFLPPVMRFLSPVMESVFDNAGIKNRSSAESASATSLLL